MENFLLVFIFRQRLPAGSDFRLPVLFSCPDADKAGFIFSGHRSADRPDLIRAIPVNRRAGRSILTLRRRPADIPKDPGDPLVKENVVHRIIQIQHIQQALPHMPRTDKEISVRAAWICFHNLIPVLLLHYEGVKDPHFQERLFQPVTAFFVQSLAEFHHFIELFIWDSFFIQSFPVSHHSFASRRLRFPVILPFFQLCKDICMLILQFPKFLLFLLDLHMDAAAFSDPEIRRHLSHHSEI